MASNSIIVGAIRACKTRTELEEVFELFAVSGAQERHDLLNKAMYSPKVFYTGCPTIEQKYALDVEVFFQFHWKLSELHWKFDFGIPN
ncbi:MAG: hypothetical protein ACTTKL_09395 [Treponema sp.]